MTSEAILFEVGGWLIMACLALIVVLLFLKLIQRLGFIFRALDYLAMPGAMVHELGHYLACKLHGIGVSEVKWFHWGYMLNRERAYYETGGVAGYVRPTEPAPNIFVQFQICAAPLLSCGLFWLLSIVGVHLLISETSSLNSTLTPLQETVAVVVLLWIGLASAASMLPSDTDMQIVLDFDSRDRSSLVIRPVAWVILAINRMLYRYIRDVPAWGAITSLATLYVLLKFSIPGGQAYLEPFGVIATAIRDFAEAAKSIN